MEEHMGIVKMAETKDKLKQMKKKDKKEKNKKTKKKKASSSSSETETSEAEVYSSSDSETKEESEGPKRKQPTRTAKKMESKKMKKIQEDSDSESESNDEEKEADLRSTEGHYVSSEIVSQRASEENMMVVQVETQSQTKALSIVPIQICLPLSQTTTVPEIEPTPAKSPSKKINEDTTRSTPEPPPKTEQSTPTLSPAPSKVNPTPEDDAAALMMMARTTSYIPKQGSMPSFSLGLTNSSQEEAATQEGAETQEGQRVKTPETPKLIEQLGELNMAIANHPEGVFLQPKTNKPFRVEDYPIYDYAIYVMKWLEIIQPENIKRGKYEWDNWTQDEVDHYRVEYASRILFHEMNQDKAEAIRGSDAIRLSRPSSLLLSPYCQIDSNDIDTD
ncbi:hypothetical protein AHAS_Ahas05G0180600 [Arachis hypogaea]